jgi:hypothetical protein
MFRTSNHREDCVTDVDAANQLEPAIRAAKPGRYHSDEISRDPLPPGHTSRRWGVGIKQADGSVMLEPDPWEPYADYDAVWRSSEQRRFRLEAASNPSNN